MLVIPTVLAMLLCYFLATRNKTKPELRECLDAIEKESLISITVNDPHEIALGHPVARFFNDFCNVLYWLKEGGEGEEEAVLEVVDMDVSGLIGNGHGIIKISWLNGEVQNWYHNATPLPPMSISDNWIANRIRETIRSEYLDINSKFDRQ